MGAQPETIGAPERPDDDGRADQPERPDEPDRQDQQDRPVSPWSIGYLGHALVKRRGDRRWDIFLRGTALAGLFLIPIAKLFPDYAALVWLAVVGLPANGPLGPILPTAFEPLMMEAVKYHPPIQ